MEIEYEIKEIKQISNKRFRVKISYEIDGKSSENVFVFPIEMLDEDNFLAKIQEFFEHKFEDKTEKIKKFQGKKFKYTLKG